MAQTFNNGDQLGSVRTILNANASSINANASNINTLQSQNARSVNNVSDLLANTTLTYTTGTNNSVVAGDIIQTRAENFSYQVAASTASDQHVATAGGVKLYCVGGDYGSDVRAWGAKIDGVTDDTLALTNCINYVASGKTPNNIVLIPLGTLVLSSPITITKPVFIRGSGPGLYAYSGFTKSVGTTIKWTGGASTIFKFSVINSGSHGMEDILIDCNNLASTGVEFYGCIGSKLKYVSILSPLSVCLKVGGSSTSTMSFGIFEKLYLEKVTNGKCALWITGVDGAGNACHLTFIGTQISIGGSANGITLGYSDNITFLQTYIYDSPGTTGYGVYIDPNESYNFPHNHMFVHLQASTRGWYQPASTVANPAQIYGYMQDNGQPDPVVLGGQLYMPDIVQTGSIVPVSGFSGGTPTFSLKWNKAGRVNTCVVQVSGTGIVAAANAALSISPSNSGNPYGFGLVTGVNYGGNGAAITGYMSGGLINLSSGVVSSSGFVFTVTFIN